MELVKIQPGEAFQNKRPAEMKHEHKTEGGLSDHLFEYRSVERKRLVLSLCITFVVMIIEVVGGILSGSIALISDAGHMFTHSFAISISLIAVIIARRPPCHHRTYGLYRAEVLAAFVNGLFLLLVVGVIVQQAILRMIHPREVLSLQMLAVAVIGLAVNVVSIIILYGSHRGSLGVRSVFYHMLADAVSSIGIVIAAGIILYTGLTIIDPLVSLGISAAILYWAWSVLRESSRILLEMAPEGLNLDVITDDIKGNFPEIKELYHPHLWSITPDMRVFSAHMKLNDDNTPLTAQEGIISRINEYLWKNYDVIETTVEITTTEGEVCNIPPRRNS